MKTNIYVIEVPTISSMLERVGSLFDDIFDRPLIRKCEKYCILDDEDDEEDDDDDEFTVPNWEDRCCDDEPWGVYGTPADPNLRFGAAFEIDEPRCEDYDKRWQFESDHAAFDRFVEAGEDCVARGLEKKSKAPIHKCNAIRQPLHQAPPKGIDLIGETHWWETTGW